MAVSLKDKVVLITGASSGFGREAAFLFAAEGAKVVLAARRIDRLQALADAIQNTGGEALVVPVDVTNRAEIDWMVQTVLELYDRVDILFNNAGFGRLAWLEDMDPEPDIDMQIQVNLLGCIHVARAVLPSMIKRRSGHIINMSSIAGWLAVPTYTVYAASKFGVRGFTEALRREVAPFNIHVSGIYPGPARTEFGLHTRGVRKKARSRLSRLIYVSTDAIARRVVRLARHPRRSVIIPAWFIPVVWGESVFKGISDWLIRTFYTNRLRRQEKK